MKKSRSDSLKPLLIELSIYALLVVGYLFIVFHFLNLWLQEVYVQNKIYYAVVALALIVVQGIALDSLTTLLVKATGWRDK